MQKITGEIRISPEKNNWIQEKIKNISDFRVEIEKNLGKNITQLIEIIFGAAIRLESSDIHIEPGKTEANTRIRIDGILQDVSVFSQETYRIFLSRIKLLSGIKLNVINRPQDGRFSVLIDESAIEIRASTLPTEYGESIVLRILNPKSLIGMNTMGLREDIKELFEEEVKRPNGMIIVTGPTGSGKTTTLYAFLKKIQRSEIKIITIEDPIEYHLKGISQTQVAPKKGYNFANGLRSIMRQDPDVILVGEIRDLETAQIALQAALTGHLVLTTLHTNDAAGTIARLTSLGAEPSNIGPAINIAIAQRLVRKICKKCSKPSMITPEELIKIKSGLQKIPKKMKIPKLSKDLKIFKPKGCQYCNFTGYRGRVGIFEIFPIDAEIEKFILKKTSIAALRDLSIKKGMLSMRQDGLIKVLQGITTIEEVERKAGKL